MQWALKFGFDALQMGFVATALWMHICVRHFLYWYSHFYSSHLPYLELWQMDRTIHQPAGGWAPGLGLWQWARKQPWHLLHLALTLTLILTTMPGTPPGVADACHPTASLGLSAALLPGLTKLSHFWVLGNNFGQWSSCIGWNPSAWNLWSCHESLSRWLSHWCGDA